MSLSSVIRYVRAIDTTSTTGAGKTGLAFGDFTAKYLVEGGTLVSLTAQDITTLGTYQAPTANTNIRIKEVNSGAPTQGIYEVHFHNDQVAVAGKNLWLFLSASGALIQPLWIPLGDLSGRIPAALTSNGNIKASLLELISTALSEGAPGRIAAAFQTFFNVASSVLTTASVNQTTDHTTNIATLLSRIVGTLATGTHNPQSGDAFARLGAPANASIAADIAAVLSAITGLNNLSALANLYGSPLLEIPDSGSTVFAFTMVVRDNEGKLVALDSSPTIAAANAAGTDRSANLSSVSNPSTGRYTFTYTVANDATPESLRITCSGTVSAEARYVEWIGAVVDYDAQSLIDSIYSIVNSGTFGNQAIKAAVDTAQADLDILTGSDGVTLATSQPNYAPATAAALSTVSTNVSTLLTRIPAALFAGITSLGDWLRRMTRKDAGTAGMGTAASEIGTGGTPTYSGTADNLEAIKDAGGGGGGGGEVTGFTDEAMQQLRVGLRATLIRVTGPVSESDDEPLAITLVIGDDYLEADGRQIVFNIENAADLPDLTDATITLRLWTLGAEDGLVEVEGEATVPTGATRTLQFEPTAAQTAALARTSVRDGTFDVQIIDADDHVITPLELRGVLRCLSPLG